MKLKQNSLIIILLVLCVVALSSCSKIIGYGVLLWSVEEPHVLSGSVLPVYIRSNIEKVWIVGIPSHLVPEDGTDKIEVPLFQLEFFNNKRKAEARAVEFEEYAHIYAENLLDALPIRDNTDNNARRVYRLRLGEVIKVLNSVEGNPPISGTGDPLPGDWLRVLTSDGIIGYCFSYRLRLYDQTEDSDMQITDAEQGEAIDDSNLDLIFSKVWSAESYQQMINSKRINVQAMERNYRFDPGQETGVARIILPDLERQFKYQKISSDGDRAWIFEGANLRMILTSSTTLTVQYTEGGGARRNLNFVNLPSAVRNIILQENARRESQYKAIFNQGPVFSSTSYGTLTLISTGNFTWTGFDLLVPQLFPAETKGTGRINMDLHIDESLESNYTGAFTLIFSDIRVNNTFYFIYKIDNQGLRLEAVPASCIEDTTVIRRSPTPVNFYFFKESE